MSQVCVFLPPNACFEVSADLLVRRVRIFDRKFVPRRSIPPSGGLRYSSRPPRSSMPPSSRAPRSSIPASKA